MTSSRCSISSWQYCCCFCRCHRENHPPYIEKSLYRKLSLWMFFFLYREYFPADVFLYRNSSTRGIIIYRENFLPEIENLPPEYFLYRISSHQIRKKGFKVTRPSGLLLSLMPIFYSASKSTISRQYSKGKRTVHVRQDCIENVYGKYKITILKQFSQVLVKILLNFLLSTFF